MHPPQFPHPAPPHQPLLTMYDLPSEDPQEPGLPDEFHDFQPQLLRETFLPPTYAPEQIFVGTDLNLYYDVQNPQWYKRPDWFAALGVGRSATLDNLRLSYVIWQEGVRPFVVVELLSPGTEDEDLGRTLRNADQPPTKWNVYEQILHVPYYAVFSRYTGELQLFELRGMKYQELPVSPDPFWMPEAGLGLGIWQGSYQNVEGHWLRWCDGRGNWIPTAEERGEDDRQRAERERNRAEQAEEQLELERARSQQLADRLRALGIEPD
jgi:Uma2 family endonuclease